MASPEHTLFVDVETDGKGSSPRQGGKLTLVGWALDRGPVHIQRPNDVPAEFYIHWADPNVAIASHTLFDAHWFEGMPMAGEYHDTRVMAWCISENTPLDLDWLVEHYVGVKMDKRLKSKAGRVVFEDDRGLEHHLDEMDTWDDQVMVEFEDYCRRDVVALRDLYYDLLEGLKQTEQYTYWREEEVPFTPLILEMEQNGMPIDLGANAELTEKFRLLADASEEKLRRLARVPANFNLGSPDQIADYLFSRWFTVEDKLPMDMDPLPPASDFEVTSIGRLWIHGHWIVRGRGLSPTPPTKRKDKTGDVVEGKHPSTSTPDLLYKHPADAWIRELTLVYRKANKLLGTYLEKFPRIAKPTCTCDDQDAWDRSTATDVDDPDSPTRDCPRHGHNPSVTRIYGRFNQAGTVTGRLSSSDPNMQNIPSRHEWGKLVRELFVGSFIIGDYDALEMRIMAHLSGDPEMLRIFREGLDPHVRTALALFGVEVDHEDDRRGIAKTVNYGVGYGAGPPKLAQTLSIDGYATTAAEAKQYLAAVKGFYPRYFQYAEHRKFQAKQGGGVNTVSGRRRHLRGQFAELASWKQMMYGERQAVNSEVQGSAADIIRRGMMCVKYEVLPRFGIRLPLLAQIHDEAIWEWVHAKAPTREFLRAIQWAMEEGHGYKLKVPLVFEPALVHSWADKGAGLESSIEAFEEEARIT